MITIIRAVQTSSACPSQWDAWDAGGNYYYLRFRHGYGTVQAMGSPENGDYRAEPVASFTDDDPWNGTIELDEFAERAGIALSPALRLKSFGQYFTEEVETALAKAAQETEVVTSEGEGGAPEEESALYAMEISSPRSGVVLVSHAPSMCEGSSCCIHNPSDHHMKGWLLTFRSDRAIPCPTHQDHPLTLSERQCEHGCGHPDPDSLAWLAQHDPEGEWGVHGCCGCCQTA